MQTLTADTFFENVLTNKKPYLVEFTASWCSVCDDIKPMLEQFEQEYSNIEFVKVDVDQDPDLADRFNVEKLPTFLLFKNREIFDCIVGAESSEYFKTKLEQLVE